MQQKREGTSSMTYLDFSDSFRGKNKHDEAYCEKRFDRLTISLCLGYLITPHQNWVFSIHTASAESLLLRRHGWVIALIRLLWNITSYPYKKLKLNVIKNACAIIALYHMIVHIRRASLWRVVAFSDAASKLWRNQSMPHCRPHYWCNLVINILLKYIFKNWHDSMIRHSVRQCLVIKDNLETNVRWNVKQKCPPSSVKTIGTWNRYLSHMRLKSCIRKYFQTRYVHWHSDMVQKQTNIYTDASYAQCLMLSSYQWKRFWHTFFYTFRSHIWPIHNFHDDFSS